MKVYLKRGAAWVILGVVVWYGYGFLSTWESPWSVPESTVLKSLPIDAPGCGEDCK